MGLFRFLTKKKTEKEERIRKIDEAMREHQIYRNEIIKHHIDVQEITDPKLKEQKLLEFESDSQNNLIRLHNVYVQLIDLYYKQRESWDCALEKCIDYCLKDISIYPAYKEAYKKNTLLNPEGSQPNTPSFQRLAIIYAKQGHIRKAISICEKAIEYGLNDKTKGGFEGRLKKLKNKI